ncbi:MAG: S1 RNA-binding domain-containing protein, partial [Eubacterium sp.]|nr:S1 RNA-binding domain-containing protein [Eubacterium sp.]
DFGAFIELEEGIDALLHVSQIAISHVEKPSDVLKVGQEVTAKIVDFNEDTKKISLSVKSLEIEKQRAEEASAKAEAAESDDSVDAPDTADVTEPAPEAPVEETAAAPEVDDAAETDSDESPAEDAEEETQADETGSADEDA